MRERDFLNHHQTFRKYLLLEEHKGWRWSLTINRQARTTMRKFWKNARIAGEPFFLIGSWFTSDLATRLMAYRFQGMMDLE
jgi:hypothetical protein